MPAVELPVRDQRLPLPSPVIDGGRLMVAIVAIVAVQLALAFVLFGTASLDHRLAAARSRSMLVVPARGARTAAPPVDRRLTRPG